MTLFVLINIVNPWSRMKSVIQGRIRVKIVKQFSITVDSVIEVTVNIPWFLAKLKLKNKNIKRKQFYFIFLNPLVIESQDGGFIALLTAVFSRHESEPSTFLSPFRKTKKEVGQIEFHNQANVPQCFSFYQKNLWL